MAALSRRRAEIVLISLLAIISLTALVTPRLLDHGVGGGGSQGGNENYASVSVSRVLVAACAGTLPGNYTPNATMRIALVAPSSFPARSDGNLSIVIEIQNLLPYAQTIEWIWTYSPFTGESVGPNGQQWLRTEQPPGGPPLTLDANQTVYVTLAIGTSPAANGQTASIYLGVPYP